MLRIGSLLLVATSLLAPALAHAYESKAGLVKRVSVNSPVFSNRNVIVELDGVTAMCVGGSQQAYFNKADLPDTFSSFVALLMAAQASGRPVIVFTIPASEGCRIDQVQLAN